MTAPLNESALTTRPAAEIGALGTRSLIAGVVGLALMGVGYALDHHLFWQSYLVAFIFLMGLTLGSLALLMVQYLSGGAWGLVSRRVFEAATDLEEAGYVVDEVRALRAEGVVLNQLAVLYRSNAQSRVLEHQLFSAGIPYRVYGGLRFFERQEIKHALAYLRLIANPDDDTSFARVVNFPTRGIGARSLEVLTDAARVYNTSLYATVPHLTGKPGTSLAQFVRLIEDHLPGSPEEYIRIYNIRYGHSARRTA